MSVGLVVFVFCGLDGCDINYGTPSSAGFEQTTFNRGPWDKNVHMELAYYLLPLCVHAAAPALHFVSMGTKVPFSEHGPA